MADLDIGEYIERFNPFMYKDEKGRIMHFENYMLAYKQTLSFIKADCPKGYFDLAVFMKQHCGMDDDSALEFENEAKKNFRLFALHRLIIIDVTRWQTEESTLKIIIKALHLITETEFSSEAFEWAYSEFLKESPNAQDKENNY